MSILVHESKKNLVVLVNGEASINTVIYPLKWSEFGLFEMRQRFFL